MLRKIYDILNKDDLFSRYAVYSMSRSNATDEPSKLHISKLILDVKYSTFGELMTLVVHKVKWMYNVKSNKSSYR